MTPIAVCSTTATIQHTHPSKGRASKRNTNSIISVIIVPNHTNTPI